MLWLFITFVQLALVLPLQQLPKIFSLVAPVNGLKAILLCHVQLYGDLLFTFELHYKERVSRLTLS